MGLSALSSPYLPHLSLKLLFEFLVLQVQGSNSLQILLLK